MPEITLDIIAAALAVVIAAAVLGASVLSRPARGRHHPVRTIHPARAGGPFGGPGTLGQAGCLPLYDAEALRPPAPEADWDLTTQLPRLGRQPWPTQDFPAIPPEVTP